tara:strand:+ start:239 stop:1081 length:843 start_codon:yes stop_codon:yes gene_type:complete
VLLKWAGGKSWLTKNHPQVFHSKESLNNRAFQNLPSITYNRYIEPFLGGGAVFKYLKPNNRSILSDINDELICFYACLKLNPKELYSYTQEHMNAHCEDYYYEIRSTNSHKDKIQKASRFLYLNRTCYNGIYRVNSKNEFNVPIGDSKDFKVSEKDFIEYSQLLSEAEIKNDDFRITIGNAEKGDLIFVDPPYVTKSNESSFNMYSGNQFDWNAQIELSKMLEIKNQEGVYIIATNINDKDICNLYLKNNGWTHIPLGRANTMSYNAKGKQYKEIIFKNF